MRPTKNLYTYKGMMQARLLAAGAVVPAVVATVVVCLLLRHGTIWGFIGVVLVGIVGAVAVALVVVNLLRSGLVFEYRIRRKFRVVCAQKGLADKVTTDKGVQRWRYASMRVLTGSNASFQLSIRPLLGHSHPDWDRAAPAFALAFGATVTRVQHDGNGLLTMKVGYQKVEAHEFEHREPVAALPSGWREVLAKVEIGKGEGGAPFLLPLLGSHTLVAGITGAGKGSVIWTILLRLRPAIDAGVVRPWGFDPKRMELAIGREFFGDRYAADADAMVALLERAHTEMQARADALAGKVRKFDPSPEHPLELIIVDELGYLVALLPDRKQREHCEKLLSALLVLGRAVGFSVIGALQDPRKEVLSFRDLFPTRVAMRLPKPMVDLVLGNGMYEAGAQCDLIPATETDGAGVAFVVDETSTLPVMLRTPWCSDDAIRSAAASLSAPAVRRLSAVT